MRLTKFKKQRIAIPDNDLLGVTDSLQVRSDYKIKGIQVHVELDHTSPSDLSIELHGPGGQKETLLSPGIGASSESMTLSSSKWALLAEGGISGEWTIKLIDAGMRDSGNLLAWSLIFLLDESPENCLIEDQSTIELSHGVSSKGKLMQLDVELEIEHDHVGDLDVIFMAPSGKFKNLHNREGKNAKLLQLDLNSFQLSEFKNEEINGEWKLIISDALKGDEGRVKNWRIAVKGDEN